VKRQFQWDKTKYPHAWLATLLGLDVGRKIGLLDPTSRPTVSTQYDRQPAHALHRQTTVVDAYSATVDLEHLQRGTTNVVFQAVSAEELYVAAQTSGSGEPGTWQQLFKDKDLVARVELGIDEHLLFVKRNRRHIRLATDAQAIQPIVQAGRIALVLMLKSGWISDDLAVLENYYQRGVRVMALCHLAPFSWADSNSAVQQPSGLSDFGRQVVRACQQLGMLVDLAHASDQTCRDALSVADRPLVVTHTKCRALSGSSRDVPDDLIRAIAAGGGAVGILAATPSSGAEIQQARLQRDRHLLGTYEDPFALAAARVADAEVWGTKLDLVHIDHAVEVAGIDHVGLASHAQNVPQWKEFTGALMKHGYSQEETEKILGGNMLRVLEQAMGPTA
jgi:microsomal dipeptidase-like Zn-dependent dipeptidase